MTKSLKLIQTFAKIAHVICKILFIIFVVAGSICLACIPLLLFQSSGDLSVYFADVNGVAINLKGGIFILSLSTLVLAAEAVIIKFYERYFRNVVKIGTPFTHAGAKEMRVAGIIDIAISFGASLFMALATEIVMGNLGDGFEFEVSISLGDGLAFILISFLLRYGADVLTTKAASTREESREDNAFEDFATKSSISETSPVSDNTSL